MFRVLRLRLGGVAAGAFNDTPERQSLSARVAGSGKAAHWERNKEMLFRQPLHLEESPFTYAR